MVEMLQKSTSTEERSVFLWSGCYCHRCEISHRWRAVAPSRAWICGDALTSLSLPVALTWSSWKRIRTLTGFSGRCMILLPWLLTSRVWPFVDLAFAKWRQPSHSGALIPHAWTQGSKRLPAIQTSSSPGSKFWSMTGGGEACCWG